MTHRIALALPALFAAFSLLADTADTGKSNYLPDFHGTLRPRYELETGDMQQRFQVRNARLSLDGAFGPVISYKFQADFCDRGDFKMLDAWVRLALSHNVGLVAGQTQIPFTVDGMRSPHLDYFANKSFISTLTGNSRGVGAKLAWAFGGSFPVTLEGGVFNNVTISDHDVWQKDLAYAVKAKCAVGDVSLESSFKTAAPDSVRINMADVSLAWKPGRWTLEGEYMYKHYTHRSFDPAHAYSAFASYWLPVSVGVFNRLSFQGRWDGMTDHSSGKRDLDNRLYLTDYARNRVTIGTTLSYLHPSVRADLRLNYENYFYHSGFDGPQGQRDKVVVELVVRF